MRATSGPSPAASIARLCAPCAGGLRPSERRSAAPLFGAELLERLASSLRRFTTQLAAGEPRIKDVCDDYHGQHDAPKRRTRDVDE